MLFVEGAGTGRAEGDRERKKQCVVAFRAPPTGDLAHNPGMSPDWESNQLPFGSQAGAQPTELQPGLEFGFRCSSRCTCTIGSGEERSRLKGGVWDLTDCGNG